MAFNPIISARLQLLRKKLGELRSQFDNFVYKVSNHPAIGRLNRFLVATKVKYDQFITLSYFIAGTVFSKTKVFIDKLELPE